MKKKIILVSRRELDLMWRNAAPEDRCDLSPLDVVAVRRKMVDGKYLIYHEFFICEEDVEVLSSALVEA
jgi:hypothetical protein